MYSSSAARVVGVGGRFVWVLDGDVLHRDNDLPAVLRRDGSQKWWYQYELRHRDRGRPAAAAAAPATPAAAAAAPAAAAPAYIGADGTRSWWWSGQYYRLDGLPAIEFANGGRVNVYRRVHSEDVMGWWLGCLAFIIILLAALVVGRSAMLAVLSLIM